MWCSWVIGVGNGIKKNGIKKNGIKRHWVTCLAALGSDDDVFSADVGDHFS